MRSSTLLTIGSLLFAAFACDIKPVDINYGYDGCHYCSMTIVDNQHAAELLNDKGKAFKYDSIECMLNVLKSRPSAEIGMILVCDYNNPGKLVVAEESVYLISQAIPSPMGAFLSASIDANKMQSLKQEHGGEIYTWQTIRSEFKID